MKGPEKDTTRRGQIPWASPTLVKLALAHPGLCDWADLRPSCYTPEGIVKQIQILNREHAEALVSGSTHRVPALTTLGNKVPQVRVTLLQGIVSGFDASFVGSVFDFDADVALVADAS